MSDWKPAVMAKGSDGNFLMADTAYDMVKKFREKLPVTIEFNHVEWRLNDAGKVVVRLKDGTEMVIK